MSDSQQHVVEPVSMPVPTHTTVVVVGAGISGLTCAYALQQAGIAVTVLESAPKVGGWIQSFSEENGQYLLEGGPNSFPSSSAAVVQLAQDLGVKLVRASTQANHRFVAMGTRLLPVPHSLWSAITTPLLPMVAKLRLLQEPFIPARPVDAPEETVAQFVERRLGVLAHTRMVQPFLTGVYAGNSLELSAKAVFPQLVEWEQQHGSIVKGLLAKRFGKKPVKTAKKMPYSLLNCAGGMHTFIQQLQQALVGNLHVNTPVQKLIQTDTGWQVCLASGQVISAAAVVVATPAFVASQLLSGVASQAAALLKAIEYAPISVVYQAFKKEGLTKPQQGFGVLRCAEVQNPINPAWLGSLWTSSIFPERAPKDEWLVSHFFGGSQHKDVQLWSAARAVEEATAQSQWLFGVPQNTKPTFTRVFNFANAIPQYTLGHTNRIQALKDVLKAVAPSLQLAGNYLQGINLNSCVLSGYAASSAIQASLLRAGATTTNNTPTAQTEPSAGAVCTQALQSDAAVSVQVPLQSVVL